MILLEALYFMLPAYLANMAPILFKWIPFGAEPINAKAFGDHKTWRGVVAGTLMGIFIVAIQKMLTVYPSFAKISLLSYTDFPWGKVIILGICFGLGALLGDLIKSYFKRRLNIGPGKPWIGFDQLDFVIGSLLAVSIFYTPPLTHIIIIFLVTPLLHFSTNIIAYFLGVKKVWW